MPKQEHIEMEDMQDNDSVSDQVKPDPLEDNHSYNWFRCEPMSLCQFFLQTDSAYHIVGELGELGVCQFRDLNNKVDAGPWGRRFMPELQRCTELEKRLGYFQKELERESVPIMTCIEPAVPAMNEFSKLETQFEHLENELRQVNNTRVDLKRRLLEHTELSSILQKVDAYFSEVQAEQTRARAPTSMDPPEANLRRRFSMSLTAENAPEIPLDPVVDIFTFTGSILSSRFNSFERILWRLSHGNILLNKFPLEETIEDPETGELQDKTLFILVCQGERLRNTCVKICESYHTNIYNCPEKSSERKELRIGVLKQIEELVTIIEKSDEHKKNILVAAAKKFKLWQITVTKMKSIYVVMNCFMITGTNLIGEAWVPDTKIEVARGALLRGQLKSQSTIGSVLTTVSTTEVPPTWNVTNKFTSGFQMIINSYGVGNYGEVNPAPYACITFPFIFAIMFGDLGHGLIMTLFALFLVIKEKQLANVKDEIFEMFFGGRYIILLMGIFSMYTGFLYNDIFAKSMNIFGSGFTLQTEFNGTTMCDNNGTFTECFAHDRFLIPSKESKIDGYYYPIGIDPIWQISMNKVLYLNTYKMKMSVIIGVMQMLFGVLLSLANHIHFKKTVNIFVEFIPQVVFLIAIFGYMNFMIFVKWFKYDDRISGKAPSILITMINMFMFKKASESDPEYLREELYDGQGTIQPIVIILAVAMIPIMLFIKPFYLRSVHRRKQHDMEPAMNDVETHMQMTKVEDNGEENGGEHSKKAGNGAGPSGGGGGGHDGHGSSGEFDFGDAFINQAIHTIEYCLGSISHTASYLRLWALSLAHSQLSEVLWKMVLSGGLAVGPPIGPIMMVIVFASWAWLSVGILVTMEGLSAFLHALRLHWVEFMSKFYSGSGYEFTPFSFKKIVSDLNASK